MSIIFIAFIILSILAIASALIAIMHSQPVKSAMALVFHFFTLAGIYLTLSAQFLAVMQIIVYAGAIMVLVIFVIMLLNQDKDDTRTRKQKIRGFAGIIAAGLLCVLITLFIVSKPDALMVSNFSQHNGGVQAIGRELYTNFLVPLEVTGILLIGAIIGAVLLAKKHLN